MNNKVCITKSRNTVGHPLLKNEITYGRILVRTFNAGKNERS